MSPLIVVLVLCLLNLIEATCPSTSDTFLDTSYGGSGGNEFRILNQGTGV